MLYYYQDSTTSKDIRNSIAKRLHDERVSHGYTLDGLAEEIGYSKPTVYKWEKGWSSESSQNTVPTMDQLVDLCALYNCSPGYLLCEYDSKTYSEAEIAKETGLLSDGLTHLNKLVTPLLEETGGYANDLFLSFINYFIAQSNTITELIFNRQLLSFDESLFNSLNSDEKDIIMSSFNQLKASYTNTDILQDGIFPIPHLKESFRQGISIECINRGYSVDEAEGFADFTYQMLDYLLGYQEQQSNFALSQEFLKIVDGYFKLHPEIMDDYKDYLKSIVK